jgi:uncharacterized protein (DUF952 family)
MRTAFHLVAEEWFRAQADTSDYLPEAFSREGFVHLTHGAVDVLAAGNRYYRADPRPYLLLTIDLDAVSADVHYDDSEQRFPHVYGPIDRCAIMEVRQVIRDHEGTFVAIAPGTQ